MQNASDLIGLPIISQGSKTQIGVVKDIYFDQELNSMVGIFTHAEGLIIHHSQSVIEEKDVVSIETDKIFVQNKSVEEQVDHEPEFWLRRDVFVGRPVESEGGKMLGSIADVVLSKNGRVKAVLVAENEDDETAKEFGRIAIKDVGLVDGVVRIADDSST